MMMTDMEEVIKGLVEISNYFFSVYHHSKDREEINKAKDRCDAAEDAIALLKEQPEIVRCNDCRHYKDGFCYNPNTYDDEKTKGNTVPDWFCADGERR